MKNKAALILERAEVLKRKTTTDDEYRDKWTKVNELTKQIAEANGGITDEMRKY